MRQMARLWTGFISSDVLIRNGSVVIAFLRASMTLWRFNNARCVTCLTVAEMPGRIRL